MQTLGATRPPVGVVFDSNFGDSLDSMLALALLHGLDSKNELRVISVSVNRPSLKAAALCDAVERFYNVAPTGFAANFFRPQPIGMATGGKASDGRLVAAVLEAKKADGTVAFPNTIEKLNDTADAAAEIRNALTAQYDGNAIVVLAGAATNLVRSMALPGVKELMARKVRYLVLAAGGYPEGAADEAFGSDLGAAQRLLAEWPGSIVAAGAELGGAVPFPAVSFERDFGWAAEHPLVAGYRAGAVGQDVPARDMAAVLYAARPNEGYWKVSEPGKITVGADGRTRFVAGAEGRHRYLVADGGQKERIQKVYAELVSVKPAPKQRFPRRPEKVEEKPKAVEKGKVEKGKGEGK